MARIAQSRHPKWRSFPDHRAFDGRFVLRSIGDVQQPAAISSL
jgi:hypothetical protein